MTAEEQEAWESVAAFRAKLDVECEQLRLRYMRARFILPGEEVVTPVRTRPTPRPRARRSHAQARSSSRGGDSGDDGPGEPPAQAADRPLARLWGAFRRALTRRDRRTDQIRWCDRCGDQAFAVDDYQRAQLDTLGFRDGLCPRCRNEVER